MGGLARWSVVVLAGVLVVAVVGLTFMGNQVSTILSVVGAPIDTGAGGPAGPTAAPAGDPAGGPPVGQGDDANPPSVPRSDLRIVYTGSLELIVDDLPAALAKARAVVLAAGGYIGASEESNEGDRSVATITYRIPATRWEDANDDLRALATRVAAAKTQATEVGGQIVDLEARIRNLRAAEASLVTIAEGVGRVSDLLEVQARLSDVRGQIEQLDGQRALLEDQVAYGTLVTTFGLEVAQVQETAAGWDPADDVDAATATMVGVGQALVSGAIWFGIVWLPLLLVLGAVVLVAWLVGRRLLPHGARGGPVADLDS